jgi:mitochondrial fission protein ELM1
MKVLWLKDSKAGHRNKALGLLRALRQNTEIDVLECDVDWRWYGPRQLLSRFGRVGLKLPVRWFVRGLPDLSGVGLILSAGGATQWPNAALAHQVGIKNVFLGSPRSLDPSNFSLIALHDPPSQHLPYFRFEIIPSLVTYDAAETATHDAGLSFSKDWGVLIGGDGEGISWRESDYLLLVSSVLAQAKKAGVGVRLATSRRTPPSVEDTIRSMAEGSGGLVGACWYHRPEAEAVPLLAMMGACSCLCVTADSMSMTHEAVSSGRPVCAVFPSNGGGNLRLLENLKKLEASGNLVCQTLPDLVVDGAEPSNGWTLIRHDPTASLADAVLSVTKSEN